MLARQCPCNCCCSPVFPLDVVSANHGTLVLHSFFYERAYVPEGGLEHAHLQAEYKEFLALGHGDIYEMEILKAVAVDRFGNPQQPPWRHPGADISDFFNFGMDLDGWRAYCAAISAYKCAFAHALALQNRARARLFMFRELQWSSVVKATNVSNC